MRLLFLCLLLLPAFALAQAPPGAHITGRITFEDDNTRYSEVKIYNKRTITYVNPKPNGWFELYGYMTDTFIFIAPNYKTLYLTYKDSCRKLNCDINIQLRRLQFDLNAVTITPDKTFEQIQQAIDDLGVENTNTYKQTSIYPNTISALYELFSKKEKEKREVARLVNEDARRQVLRELLKICIKSNLIDLSVADSDAFIDYCNFSEEYLKTTTLYNLLGNIKLHYHYFKMR